MTFDSMWFLISVLSSELLQHLSLFALNMAIESIIIGDLITEISSVNAIASQLFTLRKQPNNQLSKYSHSKATLRQHKTKLFFYNEMYNIKTRPFTTKQLLNQTIQ